MVEHQKMDMVVILDLELQDRVLMVDKQRVTTQLQEQEVEELVVQERLQRLLVVMVGMLGMDYIVVSRGHQSHEQGEAVVVLLEQLLLVLLELVEELLEVIRVALPHPLGLQILGEVLVEVDNIIQATVVQV